MLPSWSSRRRAAAGVVRTPRRGAISEHAGTLAPCSFDRGIGLTFGRAYGRDMDLPDSTFARLDAQIEDPLGWRSLAVLALVLTVAAVSAGLLIGGA